MAELKEYFQRLFEIEAEEEKYKNIMSKIKNEKDSLNKNVLKYMENNNITNKDIIFGNKKIKYGTMKVQEGITKKLIQDKLTLYFKNPERATEVTEFIYNERNSSQKPILKITEIKDK
jgi:hypothetical protein